MSEQMSWRRWYWLLYGAGALLTVVPLFSLAQAYPPHPDSPTWRASLVGLLGSTLLFPLLGLLGLALAARLLGHRLVLRAVATLLVLVGLGLVVALPEFVLDVLQLRHNLVQLRTGGVLRDHALLGFEMNAARAAVQCGLIGLMALYAGWVAWRDGWVRQARERREKSTESAAQLVGAMRRAVQ